MTYKDFVLEALSAF